MNIPKEYAADQRFNYIYNQKGHCPKCNARLIKQEQAGPTPPNMGCYACGYHDWDFKNNVMSADSMIRV